MDKNPTKKRKNIQITLDKDLLAEMRKRAIETGAPISRQLEIAWREVNHQ